VPVVAPPETRQFLDCRARVLADGLVEMSEVPAGSMPPLHVHHAEDEGFYVLDGEVSLHLPGRSLTLRAGDFALAPRGVPHTYEVGDAPARWLTTSTVGFDRFVTAVCDLDEQTPDRVGAVAAEHGIELLGPPGARP